jgi:hypothetical protein
VHDVVRVPVDEEGREMEAPNTRHVRPGGRSPGLPPKTPGRSRPSRQRIKWSMAFRDMSVSTYRLSRRPDATGALFKWAVSFDGG